MEEYKNTDADRYIRKATPSDLEAILRLYQEARLFMQENGNPEQWMDWYPPREMIEQDVCPEGFLYVCESACEIVGVFYFRVEHDPTYDYIEGTWQNDRPYGVVHRIAARKGTKGVGTFCINWAFEKCGNLKIDTHSQNVPMRRLLEKLGFMYCGTIWVLNGTSERMAFQKSV